MCTYLYNTVNPFYKGFSYYKTPCNGKQQYIKVSYIYTYSVYFSVFITENSSIKIYARDYNL
jgi:hypothetical protein